MLGIIASFDWTILSAYGHNSPFNNLILIADFLDDLIPLSFIGSFHRQLVHGGLKLSNLLLARAPVGPPAVRLAHMNAGPAFQPACKGATWCRSAESLESGRVGREDDMFAVGCCVAAMATGVVDREKGIKGHFANSPPLIQASGPLVAARPS
jgi:hypothetical protein